MRPLISKLAENYCHISYKGTQHRLDYHHVYVLSITWRATLDRKWEISRGKDSLCHRTLRGLSHQFEKPHTNPFQKVAPYSIPATGKFVFDVYRVTALPSWAIPSKCSDSAKVKQCFMRELRIQKHNNLSLPLTPLTSRVLND